MTGRDLALLAAAYLLGSVSWSYVLVKMLQGLDVRTVGSGNAGATNAMRAAGKKVGAAVLFLDIGKGVAAVLCARALATRPEVVGGAAIAVVLGHVFPVFFGFRGGKGVATATGALGALAPLAMGFSALVFILLVLWKRYVSLGSVLGAVTLPLFMVLLDRLGWVDDGGPWLLAAAVAVAGLVVFKHASNLRRLAAGAEPRLGERRIEQVGR